MNYLPVWAGPEEQRVSGLPGFLSSSSYQLQGNQVSNNTKLCLARVQGHSLLS